MKFRKVIESGIITAALALTSVTTAVSASAAETGTTTESATVNANVADRVSQAASTGVQSVQIIQQNAQAAAEAAEWADKMLVTVDKDSSLNIRKEASADAEVVGKFYAGSGAEVLETGDEWTKVKSGDVEGYVNLAKMLTLMQKKTVRQRQPRMQMVSVFVRHPTQMQKFLTSSIPAHL